MKFCFTFETCEIFTRDFGEYFESVADFSFSAFDLLAHFLEQSRKGFGLMFRLDDSLWLSVAVRPSMKQELSRACHLSGGTAEKVHFSQQSGSYCSNLANDDRNS